MVSDFGITKYCKKCGLEIVKEGDRITMSTNSKFCECDKIPKTELQEAANQILKDIQKPEDAWIDEQNKKRELKMLSDKRQYMKELKEFIKRRINRIKLIIKLYPDKSGDELADELIEDLIKEDAIKLIKAKYNPNKTTMEIKDWLDLFNITAEDLRWKQKELRRV